MHPNQQYAPQRNPNIPQYNQNYAPQQPTNIQRQFAPNGPTQYAPPGPNQYFHPQTQQRPVYQTRPPQAQAPYYQPQANIQINAKPTANVQNPNIFRQTPMRPVMVNPLAQQQSLIQMESKEIVELVDKSQPEGKRKFLMVLGISFLIGIIILTKLPINDDNRKDKITTLIRILSSGVMLHNTFIFFTIAGNLFRFIQLGYTIIIEALLFIAYVTLAILSYMEPCDGVKCCPFDLKNINKTCPDGFFAPTITFVVLALMSFVKVRYIYLWEKAKDEAVRCQKDLDLIRGQSYE